MKQTNKARTEAGQKKETERKEGKRATAGEMRTREQQHEKHERGCGGSGSLMTVPPAAILHPDE